MELSLMTVDVRRDALTVPAILIFQHEIPILHQLYGAENVEAGAQAGTCAWDIGSEYARLVRQYGEEAVFSVYGPAHSGRLEKALFPEPSKAFEQKKGK